MLEIDRYTNCVKGKLLTNRNYVFYSNLAKMLKEARVQRGMSIKTLAIAMKTKESIIKEYEESKTDIPISVFFEYLLWLGIQPSFFVREFEKKLAQICFYDKTLNR